ncbi:methyltransferase [Marinivivus vitaminiproducens]|uniref:methyltransferase n=1 Tax=Marinivivus vitaminiproducens TaxID=3035935 RepID=UPI00279A1DC1|nr:methyltransferase [Geminicoccaceae bacterium SCSIO 64248]
MNERPQEDTPPVERMMQMITGYWVTQIVHGAAIAGYADQLQRGSLSVEELAEASGIDAGAAYRHLRACAALGLVTFDGQRFSSTPLLDTLRRDHPQSLRGIAMSQPAPGHWLPWGRFADVLRTGQRQTVAALGSEIFEYFAKTPHEADAFTASMGSLTAAVSAEVTRVLDTRGVRRAVDIGGAGGALLAPLLEANPTLLGTVFDLPNVIGGEKLTDIPDHIRPRIDAVGGDFFQEVPPGDLYLLKYILHDWDDEQCVTILRNCRRSISRDGRLAVIELVLGEVGEPGLAPLMDVNMMVMLAGRERSLAEYAALLERAGFDGVKITHTDTPMAIIEAFPAKSI